MKDVDTIRHASVPQNRCRFCCQARSANKQSPSALRWLFRPSCACRKKVSCRASTPQPERIFCGVKYFLKPAPSPPFRPRRRPPSATRFFRPQSRPHQNDKLAASKTFASSGARPVSSCVAWTASRLPQHHQSPRSCAPSLLQTPACRRGRGRSSRLQRHVRWARKRPDNCAVPVPNLGAANGPRPCLHHRLPPALL